MKSVAEESRYRPGEVVGGSEGAGRKVRDGIQVHKVVKRSLLENVTSEQSFHVTS